MKEVELLATTAVLRHVRHVASLVFPLNGKIRSDVGQLLKTIDFQL